MEQRAFAVNREKFIAKVLQPWTKTFSYEFYEHIFHLKSWPKSQAKSPGLMKQLTNALYRSFNCMNLKVIYLPTYLNSLISSKMLISKSPLCRRLLMTFSLRN